MKFKLAFIIVSGILFSSCSHSSANLQGLDIMIEHYSERPGGSTITKSTPRIDNKKNETFSENALVMLSTRHNLSLAMNDAAPSLPVASPKNTKEEDAPETERLSFNDALRKLGSHFQKNHWKGSWKQAFDEKHLLLYSVLAGAAVGISSADDGIRQKFQKHHFAGKDLAESDTALAIALPAFTAFYLLPFHPPGSEEEKFDDMAAFGELMLATGAITLPLKAIKRNRPNGKNDDSFPSIHAAYAFATAAYIDDMYGEKYGWKAKLPAYGIAAFIGLSRIDKGEHFASDVLAGMAIGILAEKFIYKWHYGKGGVSPHKKEKESAALIIPVSNEEETSIYFVKSF